MPIDPRKNDNPLDANDELFDASLRHQIGIRRFTSGEVKRILNLFEKADAELVEKLRNRLARIREVTDFTSDTLKKMLDDINFSRNELMRTLQNEFSPTLFELSKLEAEFEQRTMKAAIPFEIGLNSVSLETLRAVVTKRPFQGRLLKEWYKSLAAADQARLRQAIQLGLAQGESIQQMVRRVAGTRANNFTDGALAITRRNAEAIVRTAVNHVSNGAREAFWAANADVIYALRWTATLDGRTSAICRARDGKLAPVESELPSSVPKAKRLVPRRARPPAHINCRSIMVAVLDQEGLLGSRPFVRDTRRRERREVDFRKIAKQQGKTVREVRSAWARKNIGQVTGDISYNDWLKRQPASFQDEVLGVTKGKLFRKGDLTLDSFVDRTGNELTLAELADTKPEAFISAGLDPENF